MHVESSGNEKQDILASKLINYDDAKIIQENAGNKDDSGWFKATGGNKTYSILFPQKYIEFKLPSKNNSTCPFSYSANAIDGNVQYIVEYIECTNLDVKLIASNIRSLRNFNIIKMTELENEQNPTFQLIEKTPYGDGHTKTIVTKNGQCALMIKPLEGGTINQTNENIFYNSFKIEPSSNSINRKQKKRKFHNHRLHADPAKSAGPVSRTFALQ